MVYGLWFMVYGLGFRVQGSGFLCSGFGFRVSGFVSRFSCFGFRVQDFELGCRVASSGGLTGIWEYPVPASPKIAIVEQSCRLRPQLTTGLIQNISAMKLTTHNDLH